MYFIIHKKRKKKKEKGVVAAAKERKTVRAGMEGEGWGRMRRAEKGWEGRQMDGWMTKQKIRLPFDFHQWSISIISRCGTKNIFLKPSPQQPRGDSSLAAHSFFPFILPMPLLLIHPPSRSHAHPRSPFIVPSQLLLLKSHQHRPSPQKFYFFFPFSANTPSWTQLQLDYPTGCPFLTFILD